MVIFVHVAVVLVVALGQIPQLPSDVMTYLIEGQLNIKGFHLNVKCVGRISQRYMPFGAGYASESQHCIHNNNMMVR